jgi:ferrochelatase
MNMPGFLSVLLLVTCFFSDNASAKQLIGVMFGSYGDIDDVDTELRPFIRNTLTDPDILPLPAWLRATIADAGWYIERRNIRAQYKAIGGRTNSRALSQEQARLVAEILGDRGSDVRPYVGFTMTTPFVADALDAAQEDGIETLYVIYQGAQYAKDTAQILFRHVQEYLKKHPSWQVKVVGIRSFSDDRRFASLLASNIERRLEKDFSGYSADDICLFLTAHGNVLRSSKESDEYLMQVRRIIQNLKERFHNLDVSYGFHNHDEIPGIPWSQPSNGKAMQNIAQKPCQAVLVNGQISFTVDNLETLYNQVIEIPALLNKETEKLKGKPKKIVVDGAFNNDPEFVHFMADLVEEAARGEGDLTLLSPLPSK